MDAIRHFVDFFIYLDVHLGEIISRFGAGAYAILFLIFDVEVLFLLPFAVAFTGLSAGALVAMLVFILLLAEGLVWAWHRGYLEWK